MARLFAGTKVATAGFLKRDLIAGVMEAAKDLGVEQSTRDPILTWELVRQLGWRHSHLRIKAASYRPSRNIASAPRPRVPSVPVGAAACGAQVQPAAPAQLMSTETSTSKVGAADAAAVSALRADFDRIMSDQADIKKQLQLILAALDAGDARGADSSLSV